jgi:hypothetical protein
MDGAAGVQHNWNQSQPNLTEPNTPNLQRLLPHGAITALAKKLSISTTAVSQALKTGKPSHPAVQEAIRMAQASGALATAQALATLTLAK